MAEILLGKPYNGGNAGETFNYTVPSPSAGFYTVNFQGTCQPLSQLSVTVKHNGSGVFTSPVLAINQSAVQFKFTQYCAATDTLEIDIAGGNNANDKQLNSIAWQVSLYTGE